MTILALDVHYDESNALAYCAGVVFSDWTSESPQTRLTRVIRGIQAYEPGEFFRRELPCLLPVVEDARSNFLLSCIVVDGFVDLGERGPGLGRHLYHALADQLEVVGVAKNPFAGCPGLPVLRGESKRPLWVTSTGDVEEAAKSVASMDGPHRIPTLLTIVDRLARDTAAAAVVEMQS